MPKKPDVLIRAITIDDTGVTGVVAVEPELAELGCRIVEAILELLDEYARTHTLRMSDAASLVASIAANIVLFQCNAPIEVAKTMFTQFIDILIYAKKTHPELGVHVPVPSSERIH